MECEKCGVWDVTVGVSLGSSRYTYDLAPRRAESARDAAIRVFAMWRADFVTIRAQDAGHVTTVEIDAIARDGRPFTLNLTVRERWHEHRIAHATAQVAAPQKV